MFVHLFKTLILWFYVNCAEGFDFSAFILVEDDMIWLYIPIINTHICNLYVFISPNLNKQHLRLLDAASRCDHQVS